MSSFETLSLEPGFDINPDTWESKELTPDIIVSNIKDKVSNYVSPSYSQLSIDLAREVSQKMWEKLFCSLLWWKIVKRWNNKWFDIILPNWETLEAKSGRIWSSPVIKICQLGHMKKWYYWLSYYRTTGNKLSSFFTSQDNWLKPDVYFKRNMTYEYVFVFPREFMVFFYNSPNVKQWIISTTWVCHKSLSLKRALELFNSWEWDYIKYEKEVDYWRHKIRLMSVWYKI